MNEDKSKCTKNFPKQFNEETIFLNIGSYPVYRRRNDGKEIIFSSQKIADNRFVVPYNPYLLLKLRCHINVEVCNTIKSIKYLFKYFYKGPDTAIICLSNSENTIEDHAHISVRNIASECDNTTNVLNYDEIEQYTSTRYVCPPAAMYRIYKFKLHDQSHVIYRLAVHLKDEQYVYFKHGSEKEMIDKNLGTTLTAWFDLNNTEHAAKQYLYNEIPQHYVFHKKSKTWNPRKKVWKPILSRMYFVSPKVRERFYLMQRVLKI